MRGPVRALLVLEMVGCFAPIALMLLLATFALPMQVYVIVAEPIHARGAMWLTIAVFGGIAGLWALIRLLRRVLAGGPVDPRPVRTVAAALLGLLSAGSFGIAPALAARASDEDLLMIAVFLLPVAGGLHVLWLARPWWRPTLTNDLHALGTALRRPAILVPAALTITALALWLAMRPSLEDRLAHWRVHRPARYTYEPHFAGERPPHRGVFVRVTVVGDRVTHADYVGLTPEVIASMQLPPPESIALTMDGLYERLIEERRSGASVTLYTSDPGGRIWQADVDHGDRRRYWSVIVNQFDVGPSTR